MASVDADAIGKIAALAAPNIHEVSGLEFTDKSLTLIVPPEAKAVDCSTLQGFVDLFEVGLDLMKQDEVFIQVASPTEVMIVSRESDTHGRRHVWAEATYPGCECFKFGAWLNPESFLISAQQGFQRVKIETADGQFTPDLEYVLKIAANITAENATSHEDDGFAQRVAIKQGIVLKGDTILKPTVDLAPYRTFAEIDQVVSQFVFRARVGGESIQLALFEGDGGRWKIGAAAAIKAWLIKELPSAVIVS